MASFGGGNGGTNSNENSFAPSGDSSHPNGTEESGKPIVAVYEEKTTAPKGGREAAYQRKI